MIALTAIALLAITIVATRYEPLITRLVRVLERRTDLAAQQHIDFREARKVRLANKHAEQLAEIEAKKQQPSVQMPEDLASWAAQWNDKFARDSALTSMRELYEKTGSWDAVRLHYSLQAPEQQS